MKYIKKIAVRTSKFFKDSKEHSERKMLRRRVEELRDTFTIDERNGKIYILCDNTPVYEAELQETTESVIERMRAMRQTVYQYYNVIHVKQNQSNN